MNSPGPREHTDSPTVTVTLFEGVVEVELCGEVDVGNVDKLRAALARADLRAARGVCIDLSRLTFCDVTGCEVLLGFERRARGTGLETRMLGASSSISKVMGLLAPGPMPHNSPGRAKAGTPWQS
jgi:anti-sigma B factor antagonist